MYLKISAQININRLSKDDDFWITIKDILNIPNINLKDMYTIGYLHNSILDGEALINYKKLILERSETFLTYRGIIKSIRTR